MHVGLFGKTNVGKSTFFEAATQAQVKIGNFPFTTIVPNTGIAYVTSDCPCKHFKIFHQHQFCRNGMRLIPIKLIDVAGLVPGASVGKGLGNKFLDDSRNAQILIHVVDISGSTDSHGHPQQVGSNDPLNDIKFIENEFEIWFKQILKRECKNLLNSKDKTMHLLNSISNRFSGLSISRSDIHFVLNKLKLLTRDPHKWLDDDIDLFVNELRKKSKPMMIAANKVDLCKDLKIVDNIVHDHSVFLCSAATELILMKAKAKGFINYNSGDSDFVILRNDISQQQLDALNNIKILLKRINSTGIQIILNTAVFGILNYIVVYPVEDENTLSDKSDIILPDAKLLPPQSTIKDLANEIHADMATGFLYAIDIKTKKRIGEDHKLKHGDVIKIISSLHRK